MDSSVLDSIGLLWFTRSLPLLSSPLLSCFLKMYHLLTVDFDTPIFLAMSLIHLFRFFSLMMACSTNIDTYLVLVVRQQTPNACCTPKNRLLLGNLNLTQLPKKQKNEKISSQLSKKMATFPTLLIQYDVKTL